LWRNFQNLRHSWTREQEATARLTVAIKETNHRIKNNLQVVCSLLDVQLLESDETISRQAIEETVQQVRAIAAVHDFLSHEMRDATVQGDLLLKRLVALTATPAQLSIHLEASAVALEVKQATALALIANELLLNAGKHGATEATVRMRSEGQNVCFQVSDNGPGFAADFDPIAHANLGLSLVGTLVRHDLGGDVAYHTRNGAEISITFPLPANHSLVA
jgi:two-component sensor histidine kinase